MYNPIYESVNILVPDVDSSDYGYQAKEVLSVLEDANSPLTAKYKEKLYEEILNKARIDFDDIPKSQGNIRNYAGYGTMTQTIEAIRKMAEDAKNKYVIENCDIVSKAIDNIANLSNSYQNGFTTRTEYVALEYNVYVYTCVQATTALLNNFVDYIRTPGMKDMPELKNTKLRADKFYFDQLKKFNLVQDQMGIEYRQMLDTMCTKGRNNLVGTSTLIGIGTVSAVALAIVPVTRELIYQIYALRVRASEALERQANFLELNAESIKYKDELDPIKRKNISEKQKKLVGLLRKFSDKMKVSSAKSIVNSKKEIQDANKKLSLDDLRKEVSNSSIEDMMLV